jgi:23S rRNA U2552 (ribose-2'-O)-methylase RlmE/FtsJ
MQHKGCAVVLLCNREVLERSVRQRVAVIDGVCVEVRRHSRKPKDGEQPAGEGESQGVFVAWGNRVARKVGISDEGIEAYFNGLVGKPCPEGLDPRAPFEESFQSFPLSSSGSLPLNERPRHEEATREQLLGGPHGAPEKVRELWKAKERLDALWALPPPPMGRSVMQRVARDQLFPHSGGAEGKNGENRAGDKLAELAESTGLLEGVPVGSAFLDLCGGPGAWSQFLLGHRHLGLRGYGLTLRSGAGSASDWKSEEKDDWYEELYSRPDWRAIWGKDGTGDLLKPGNVEHAAGQLWKEAGGVFLCLADGGFSDDAIPANQLELYFYRLLLAELLMAMRCLQPGGRFVCKLYSAFSPATAALLFLATRVFGSVRVVKPKSSRVAGIERYLVASGFLPGPEAQAVRRALERSHAVAGGIMDRPLLTPVVDPRDLAGDEGFLAQLGTMATTLCERQTQAIDAITQRAEYLEAVALEALSHSELADNDPCWAEDDHRGERRRDGRRGGRR